MPRDLSEKSRIQVVASLVSEIPSLLHDSITYGTDPLLLLRQAQSVLMLSQHQDELSPDVLDPASPLTVMRLQRAHREKTSLITILNFNEERIQEYLKPLLQSQGQLRHKILGARAYSGAGGHDAWTAFIEGLAARHAQAVRFSGQFTGLILASTTADQKVTRQAVFRELSELVLSTRSPLPWIEARLATFDRGRFKGSLPDDLARHFADLFLEYREFVHLVLAAPLFFNAQLQLEPLAPMYFNAQLKGPELLSRYQELFLKHQLPAFPSHLQQLAESTIQQYGIIPVKKLGDERVVETKPFTGELVLVPKLYALARGFVASDCSTQFSSLFALSKYEHVAFIRVRGEYKGYAAWTEVSDENGPAIYLHTIQGNIRAEEVPSLLGLIQSYAWRTYARGSVPRLLLPSAKALPRLINNPTLQNVVATLTRQGTSVPLAYRDEPLRRVLVSHFGMADYDTPDTNPSAIDVRLLPAPIEVSTESVHAEVPALDLDSKILTTLLISRLNGDSNNALAQLGLSREQFDTAVMLYERPHQFTFKKWWAGVKQRPAAIRWIRTPVFAEVLKRWLVEDEKTPIEDAKAWIHELNEHFDLKKLLAEESWDDVTEGGFSESLKDLTALHRLLLLIEKNSTADLRHERAQLLRYSLRGMLEFHRTSAGVLQYWMSIDPEPLFDEPQKMADEVTQHFSLKTRLRSDYLIEFDVEGIAEKLQKLWIVEAHYSMIERFSKPGSQVDRPRMLDFVLEQVFGSTLWFDADVVLPQIAMAAARGYIGYPELFERLGFYSARYPQRALLQPALREIVYYGQSRRAELVEPLLGLLEQNLERVLNETDPELIPWVSAWLETQAGEHSPRTRALGWALVLARPELLAQSRGAAPSSSLEHFDLVKAPHDTIRSFNALKARHPTLQRLAERSFSAETLKLDGLRGREHLTLALSLPVLSEIHRLTGGQSPDLVPLYESITARARQTPGVFDGLAGALAEVGAQELSTEFREAVFSAGMVLLKRDPTLLKDSLRRTWDFVSHWLDRDPEALKPLLAHRFSSGYLDTLDDKEELLRDFSFVIEQLASRRASSAREIADRFIAMLTGRKRNLSVNSDRDLARLAQAYAFASAKARRALAKKAGPSAPALLESAGRIRNAYCHDLLQPQGRRQKTSSKAG